MAPDRRSHGFTTKTLNCIRPELGSMVGLARTVSVRSTRPSPLDPVALRDQRFGYLDYLAEAAGPTISIVQDLDDGQAGFGSFWGEVQANIHTRRGCVGTVTDGGVRDLDEMRDKGFNAFAAAVLVSHANIHIVAVNVPITVGGLTVNPGDLVLGDQHGVTEVPLELVAKMPAAVERVEAKERTIIDLCNSPEFTLDKLKAMYPG